MIKYELREERLREMTDCITLCELSPDEAFEYAKAMILECMEEGVEEND